MQMISFDGRIGGIVNGKVEEVEKRMEAKSLIVNAGKPNCRQRPVLPGTNQNVDQSG